MRLSEAAWQTFAGLAAAAMRLVPRRARYRLALRIARAIAPLAAPQLMKRPHRYSISPPLDETIRATLRVMSRRGIAFDPEMRCDAPPDLQRTIRERGAIIVGAHCSLNAMMTRYLHDLGCPPLVLRGFLEDDYIWGLNELVDSIGPSPTILVTLREQLRLRRAVVMVIDRAEPEKNTTTIETQFRPLYVKTPIFDFARRLDVPLYFHSVLADRNGQPEMYIRRIEPSLEAFAAVLRAQIAASQGLE